MLEFDNVCFSADGNEILHGVSFKVSERFVAVTGPNGGGKSTIAKLIAGIYKPDSGKIYLDGRDITDISVTDRARAGISYAFQQPVRFKGLTVKDLISLAVKQEGKTVTTAEACEYLSEVGLCAKEYINREINASLSGGELKRIEIAITMARGTALTVFDEPEAGIDLWSFNNLIDVFRKMYERTKGSIIIISHQERILDIADKIIVVSNGNIAAEGAKAQILPELLSGKSFGCSTLSRVCGKGSLAPAGKGGEV